jgi:hypothetical protein
MLERKEYHNCRPVDQSKPTFYDGVKFEYANGTGDTVWIALESNHLIAMSNGFPDGLQSHSYRAGVYDPETARMVRPNEKITLWDASKGCGVDNMKCDGEEGREIVMVRNDIDSIPLIYTWEDYGYAAPFCCVETIEEECEESCCDHGTILTKECSQCEANPCEV